MLTENLNCVTRDEVLPNSTSTIVRTESLVTLENSSMIYSSSSRRILIRPPRSFLSCSYSTSCNDLLSPRWTSSETSFLLPSNDLSGIEHLHKNSIVNFQFICKIGCEFHNLLFSTLKMFSECVVIFTASYLLYYTVDDPDEK